MIGALAARLPTVALRRTIPNIDRLTVALFPQESWRDPDSGYLTSAFHDVPRHVPEFIAAYRSQVAPEPPDWVQIMRRYAREPRRILQDTTKSQGLIDNLIHQSAKPTPPV